MSAAAHAPACTSETDPHRPATPSRIGRVRSVLRRLIDYGKQLADTVQQRAAAPDFALFARPYGTIDVAVILARIANGLRRAAALEAALNSRAARGRDLTPTPVRLPAASGSRQPRQHAPSEAQPENPLLASLPSEEAIAAEVRRRPVGAVIADICHDLGITPGQLDRAFWDELCHAIIAYGGSLASWLDKLSRQPFTFGSSDSVDEAGPDWPAAPPRSPTTATGPP